MSAHSGSRSGQNQNNWGESRDQLSTGPAQEQHVPVRGFNAAEAKAALKRNSRGTLFCDVQTPIGSLTVLIEPKPFFYKPGGKDTNRSGPWGSKPNTMANGKDFFLELRKQITNLRQGDNVAGG
ncbi:hypothetical protein OAory_01011570 [Aspergillus oryzae]|uniref:Uncharacterized protein n=1 Tax=Aspergillus oryzae TaxID=5062 RepID=A0A1S9DWE1_ASPOZ|nr:uncharacterized protein G4B84_001813 [Aspergillus flavus NRRL3357]OOO13408.1 hypothetical protein OAory_01011570 [Aspergillus oryzae]QMW26568.1 hypothetical protein G4B84_001813 [Aspergillus flavus NRRL3357]QMW38647.1 hypothetical protein G4B11_001883 [Aspergillus flavus]